MVYCIVGRGRSTIAIKCRHEAMLIQAKYALARKLVMRWLIEKIRCECILSQPSSVKGYLKQVVPHCPMIFAPK